MKMDKKDTKILFFGLLIIVGLLVVIICILSQIAVYIK